MNRIASLTLLAGLLAALAPGVADADPITYDTTPFTGQTTTDFTNLGNVLTNPFMDNSGNTISFGSDSRPQISEGYGLALVGYPNSSGTTVTVTFSLAALTNEIGFSFRNANANGLPTDYLASATFSDGTFTDTFTGGTSYKPLTIPFMSFTDDRSFNSVTLHFSYASSKNAEIMTGFVYNPAVVPEPVMAVNLAIAAAMGFGFRSYRRWLIATSAAYESDESGTPTPA